MSSSPLFETVKVSSPKYSNFDLSHDNKLTCDMGYLIPTLCQEVLPGDEFRVETSSLVKFMPLLAPVMHKIDVYFHNFFVPNRLLNSHFEDFITGGENGTYANPLPYVKYGYLAQHRPKTLYNGSLLDYLGLPTFGTTLDSSASTKVAEYTGNTTPINWAPITAYNLIWQEYYRDQNLENKILDKTKSWFNASGNFTDFANDTLFPGFLDLRKRAWKKDYFTSALPWAQKGTPVSITMEGVAPVYVDRINNPRMPLWYGVPSTPGAPGPVSDGPVQVNTQDGIESPILTNDLENVLGIDPNGTMFVTATDFDVTTINELRFAFRAQEFLEKNARGGSRYIESLLAHFGVVGKDARLQRPQYLGGSVNGVVISENLQTSASAEVGDGVSPLGNQSGQGTGVGSDFQFKHSFDEHGYVIQIMSIMPKATYSNGLSKMWTRMDKLDYAWPEFGNLGEQEILRQEVNYLPESSTNPATHQPYNSETFGYTPRFAEYKFALDSVHGEFKNTLSQWHLGREFGDSVPYLNDTFIHCSPRTNIFAVETLPEEGISSHHILVELYHNITAKRALPFYGTPTF